MCTGAERAARCGRTAHNGWAADPRSLSVMPERTAGGGVSPNRRLQLLGEAPNEGEGLRVGGHALGRAPAGMQDGRVVATREARADGGEGLTGVLAREVHRDLARPGEARRAARLVERSSSRLRPKASAVMSWMVSTVSGAGRSPERAG